MKVKTPKEDPSIKSARDREERRADAAFIENTSGLLDDETRKRIRRFGKRSGAARAVAGGVTGASGSTSGSTGGSGSFDPGVGSGGFTGSGGGFSDSVQF